MAGQTITKPRGDKTQRYVFYLGIILAAIAAIVVFVAVNSSDSGTSSGGDVPVVVAQQDIAAQSRITSDMLKVEFVSSDQASADAFTSRSQLVDRVVTQDVAAGTQILPATVSDFAGEGLAFKVEPGTRGISVNVREVVIAGGNIKPGDHVDMVGLFQVDSVEAANHLLTQLGTPYSVAEPQVAAPTAAEGEEEAPDQFVLTVTLLQNVKVLGLAQTLTPTSGGGTVAEELEETDTEPRAATATLQLVPGQAQMITTADEHGVLRMDVRAPGDAEIVEVQPTLVVVK